MNSKKLNLPVSVSLFIIMLVIQMSCATKTPTDLTKESIIPKPVSITATGGVFEVTEATNIYINGGTDELEKIGQYLADKLNPSTCLGIEVIETTEAPGAGNIYLSMSDAGEMRGEEEYELIITKKMIKLIANSNAGFFRGVQTIRQLLPAKVELTSRQEGPWTIATGTIIDYPVYSYRGAMLDVARHFFGVDDVKRFIDFLSYYKMNALHLHLSDDQGWRIEIKSWPNLTIHGGSTQVGGGKGGYYTQDQYSDIVQYANERYIMVIPEIDVPGHTNAALASYPELNCNGKATKLYTGTEVGFSSLCTKKEITYKFIDDVVRELAAINTGSYIHIGGDESLVTKKEDYIPFINRVQDIVITHGKKVIGWDEISLSTLRENTIAQYWANAENAKKAVAQGAQIIVSPAAKAYLDMQYDSTTTLGLHWAGYIEVDSAYLWDPATLVPGIGRENILGVEAPLWTETITTMDEIEYMVFPRLPGIAEIGWTPAIMRNWDEYKERLGKHGERFKNMDIDYYSSGFVPWNREE